MDVFRHLNDLKVSKTDTEADATSVLSDLANLFITNPTLRERTREQALRACVEHLRENTVMYNDRVAQVFLLYRDIVLFHQSMLHELNVLKQEARASKIPLEALTDCIHMFSKSSNLFEDMRKELNGASLVFQTYVCTCWVQQNLNNPSEAEPIRGNLAVGTPTMKVRAVVPRRSKHPERFAALMQWLGVSEKQIETGILDVRWPTFQELIQQLNEDGKPLPPGIVAGETYTEPSVRTRVRRGVDIDDLDSLSIHADKEEEEPIEDNQPA